MILNFTISGDYLKALIESSDSFIKFENSIFYMHFPENEELFVTFTNIIYSRIEFDNFTICMDSTRSTFHILQSQLSNCSIKNSFFE